MLSRAFTRDRILLLLPLLGVAAIAWLYLVVMQQRMAAPDTNAMRDMNAMAGMAGAAMPGMATARAWNLVGFAATFVMWWVMMLAMMLPSTAPMVLTYATIARSQRESGRRFVPASVFAGGYLLVWGAFSAGATVLQWGLDRSEQLSPMLQTKSTVVGGAVFVLAGVYQFTPFKTVCLRHCRSPFAFLLTQWRDGWRGALHMGARHGLYCLGCCWILMLVLFAVGVMNLLWVAALTALVLAEKLLPGGRWVARIAGVVLLAIGADWLARGIV